MLNEDRSPSIMEQCRYDSPIIFDNCHTDDYSIPFDSNLKIKHIKSIKDALNNYFHKTIIGGHECKDCKRNCDMSLKN